MSMERMHGLYKQPNAVEDAEPITTEWIATIFDPIRPQDACYRFGKFGELVWLCRFGRITLYDHPQPNIKTRGQLRRLIAALKGE